MKVDSLGRFRRQRPVQTGLDRIPLLSEPPSATPLALPGSLFERLQALKRRHRAVGVVRGLAILVSAAVLLLIVQAQCDWWFDLPLFARAAFVVGDVALLGTLYRRHLHPALRRRLTLAQTALLVEKRWPALQQSLIAAVQLAEGRGYSTRGSGQLVTAVLDQARARSTSLDFKEVVPVRALHQGILACGGVLLFAGGAMTAAWPASEALLERIVLLDIPLPTKTVVVPITRDLSVPVGSDVVLRAQAAGIIPEHGRITITYDGEAPQEYSLDVVPGQPGMFRFALKDVQSAFKYRFTLNDGHSPDFTVTAETPPAILSIVCRQTFPSYTRVPPRSLPPSELSLLAGSRLHITATATAPLGSAKIALHGLSQIVDATVSGGGSRFEADIPIPAHQLTGFSIHLAEPSGLGSINETVYPIEIVQDAPPVVKILEPVEDQETITPSAAPFISFDASDDYGLKQLVLCYQIIPPPVAGQESTPMPKQAQLIAIRLKPPDEGSRYDYQLDVAAQRPAWKEGDTIKYWVEATDNNTVTGPGVTRTISKEFSVISVAAKQAEILEHLRQKAKEIDQMYSRQESLNSEVRGAVAPP